MSQSLLLQGSMGGGYSKIPVKRRRASKLLYMVAAILFFGVLITFVNIYQLRSMHYEYMGHAEVEGQGHTFPGRRPRVWVNGKHVSIYTQICASYII